jgi:CRISPR system Cascade subunit CasD
MANTLFLRLEGPLQGWGERAQWSVRDTATEPTKSGVVGLLACALGWNSDDDLRRLSQQIRLGVRCDRPGVPLVDYHTAGGGYKTAQLLTAEGKPKLSSGRPHTEQTWRHYLCDASFVIAVQADDAALIAQLADAIQSPHWLIYLGRKSCPPSRPPFEGTGDYPSLEEALRAVPIQLGKEDEKARLVRAQIECLPAEGVRRRDQVDARSHRTFLPRYTKDISLNVPVKSEEA